MVRTIIKPNKPKINLSIPVEYVGEEVEILVFPISGMNIPPTPAKDSATSAKPAPVFKTAALPKDLEELYGIFEGTKAPDKKELRRMFHEKSRH